MNATYQGSPTIGSGKVKFQVNPARSDTIITLTVAGKTAKVEEIDDISASVIYAKTVDTPNAANNSWTKLSVSDNSLSYAQILAFDSLSNAQLVGAEMQQNIPVWHIRGDTMSESSTSTGDLYIRKDTYYAFFGVTTPGFSHEDETPSAVGPTFRPR